VAGGINSTIGINQSLSANTGYIVQIDGIFTVNGLSTCSLQVGSLNTTPIVIESYSYMDIMPV
jgi:hypothetical protein